MRKSVLIFCCLFMSISVFAQADTTAYNTQRIIINKLLQERSTKFSQYDNSLSRKSGIFGLKTKKDMQASNDILTQIVLTDNNIFSELKILLDYKDFEKKEVEHRAETVEGRIERFQETITRLQQENDKLKVESVKQKRHANMMVIYLDVLIFALFVAVFYAIKQRKLRKSDI